MNHDTYQIEIIEGYPREVENLTRNFFKELSEIKNIKYRIQEIKQNVIKESNMHLYIILTIIWIKSETLEWEM